MNSIKIQGREIITDTTVISVPYRVLDAFCMDDVLIVLLDPEDYLADEKYRMEHRRTGVSLPNLLGYDFSGARIWEAEFPRHSDYYYKIASRTPLVAYSFSSYSCEIDTKSGQIKAKSFFK